MDGMFVEMAVVLYQSELPILFSYKEKWSGAMRGGPSNGPPRKVFLDKFSQLVMFFRAQGIYFGGLRFKGWFEVDGVVPEAVLGESLRPSFAENVEIGMVCLGDVTL